MHNHGNSASQRLAALLTRLESCPDDETPLLVCHLLRKTGTGAGKLAELSLAKTKLQLNEATVLWLLHTNGPQSQQTLADSILTNRNAMVIIVDNLEHDRLVRRATNPDNRRENLIQITAQGEAKLREAAEAVCRGEIDILFAGFTPAEISALRIVALRLYRNIMVRLLPLSSAPVLAFTLLSTIRRIGTAAYAIVAAG